MAESRSDVPDAFWTELGRLARMSRVERILCGRGFSRIAGVDEAGRGCFAGPVVAAAVVLPEAAVLPGLDDSKKLTAAERHRLFAELERLGAEFAFGIVSAADIDATDILAATRQAMMAALDGLPAAPDVVVTDATELPACALPVLPVVRGDSRVAVVAAASVVAKVTRDSWMDEAHRRFPWYGFDAHRGYGTEAHRSAIVRHGPSPLHRFSFRGVIPAAAAA